MTMTKPYQHKELDQEIITMAEDISLADLLECPSCQGWLISTLSNILLHSHRFESQPHDLALEAKLNQIFNKIPRTFRSKKYMQCSNMIKLHQESVREEYNN